MGQINDLSGNENTDKLVLYDWQDTYPDAYGKHDFNPNAIATIEAEYPLCNAIKWYEGEVQCFANDVALSKIHL
jgi:hypothetical protein